MRWNNDIDTCHGFVLNAAKSRSCHPKSKDPIKFETLSRSILHCICLLTEAESISLLDFYESADIHWCLFVLFFCGREWGWGGPLFFQLFSGSLVWWRSLWLLIFVDSNFQACRRHSCNVTALGVLAARGISKNTFSMYLNYDIAVFKKQSFADPEWKWIKKRKEKKNKWWNLMQKPSDRYSKDLKQRCRRKIL